MRIAPGSGIALLLAGASGACSGSHATTATAPPPAGGLTVSITAPSGVTPRVVVSGPSGYLDTLRATQTLAELVPGAYSITAAPFEAPDKTVGAVYAGSVQTSPATVTVGDTISVAVRYATRLGTGTLWVSNSENAQVYGYTSAQLDGATAPSTPSVIVSFAGTYDMSGVSLAFDRQGNLWAEQQYPPAIVEAPVSQLDGSYTTPAITLPANYYVNQLTGAIAFDTSGNLWAAAGFVVMAFSAAQVQGSVSAMPPAIGLHGSSISGASGLAFDRSGNLWVSNQTSSTIVMFTSQQLTASGEPQPTITLTSNGALYGATGLAFDRSGNLWVAVLNTAAVVMFDAGQLQSSGLKNPAVTLTGSLILAPTALAFDATGNLWVANGSAGGQIVEFAANAITASGSPTPIMSFGEGIPSSLAFDPPASGLPLPAPSQTRRAFQQ